MVLCSRNVFRRCEAKSITPGDNQTAWTHSRSPSGSVADGIQSANMNRITRSNYCCNKQLLPSMDAVQLKKSEFAGLGLTLGAACFHPARRIVISDDYDLASCTCLLLVMNENEDCFGNTTADFWGWNASVFVLNAHLICRFDSKMTDHFSHGYSLLRLRPAQSSENKGG